MQTNEYLDKIKKYTYVSDIEEDYYNFLNHFTCKPDRTAYPYPKIDTVLDEEKSVRWNREEVERLRAAYDNKVKELNQQKNKIDDAFKTKFIQLLSEDNSLTVDEGKLVYDYAWRESHDDGIYAVRGTFEDIAELVVAIKNLKK